MDRCTLALEMLAYLYHEWEYGEPCYAISDGEVHTDDPLGNAFRLGDEEDSIIAILERFFPSENVRNIDPKTWPERLDALERARAAEAGGEVGLLRAALVKYGGHTSINCCYGLNPGEGFVCRCGLYDFISHEEFETALLYPALATAATPGRGEPVEQAAREEG